MKLEDVTKKPFKLYVDLDGVLADFMTGASKDLNFPVDEARLGTDNKYRNMFWKKVREFSSNGGELWRHLDKMPDADVLWNYVKQFNPTILTAAGDPKYNADPQKRAWIQDNLGDVPTIVVQTSKEKASLAGPDSILVDDRAKSIDPWTAAGGKGVLHTSAANSIAQLKKLGVE